MTRNWRVGDTASFSRRRLGRQPRSTASIILAFAFLSLGLLAAEAASWQNSGNRMQAALRSGARVWVVEDQTGQLPAPTCEAMNHLEGVESAFAVANEPGRVVANGHMQVPLGWVTPGALEYLGVDGAPQAVVGSALSRLVVSNSGEVASLGAEPIRSTVAPSSSEDRQGFLSSSVMVPTALEQSRYCIVEFTLEDEQLIRAELAQTFSRRSGAAVDIRRLNSEFLSYDSAARQRSQRASRFGWLIGAPMSAALVLFLLRSRRNDLAVMTLLGAARSEICLAVTLQIAMLVWSGAGVAMLVAAALTPMWGTSVSALTLGSSQALVSAAAATLVGLIGSWQASGSMLAADAFKSHD